MAIVSEKNVARFHYLLSWVKDPDLFRNWLLDRKGKQYDDEEYLRRKYKIRFHKEIELEHPKTFNEKLNWLKLHNHDELYHTLVDKYAVKKFVADAIGEEYVVPCYGMWKTPEEIDLEKLPNQFVLKCNHNSGEGMLICKDKSEITPSQWEAEKAALRKGLKRDFFLASREWPYKDLHHCILADMFLNDGSHEASASNSAIKGKATLVDYKFWCFNGVPKAMYITVKDRQVFENFYDKDFKPMNINHGFERHKPEFEKPEGFEKMWELAGKLSTASGSPFVRVDFFNVKGNIYFGEFTFFDWGGMRPFKDPKQDLEIGGWLKLPID